MNNKARFDNSLGGLESSLMQAYGKAYAKERMTMHPPSPHQDKKLAIWESKDRKAYALIAAFVSENR